MVGQQLCQATTRPCLRGVKEAPAPLPRALRPFSTRTPWVTRAEQEMDFDALLEKVTEKFEKAENKPVVIGYGVGALLALFFTEWLIHLPLLNALVGFPIQLVGVVITPLLVIRYVLDKEDWYADAEGQVEKVADLLPGLKK